jgi:hypothetical protein
MKWKTGNMSEQTWPESIEVLGEMTGKNRSLDFSKKWIIIKN